MSSPTAEPLRPLAERPGLAIVPEPDLERPRPIAEPPEPNDDEASRQEVLRGFTESVQNIDPEEFDLKLEEMVSRFRGHLEGLFRAMSSVQNLENRTLALTHRVTISQILEASLTATKLKELFEQFEKAHEISGTINLEQAVGKKYRKVMSLMAMLDSILNRGNGAWKLIESEDTDLARAVYGVGIWMSEEG